MDGDLWRRFFSILGIAVAALQDETKKTFSVLKREATDAVCENEG